MSQSERRSNIHDSFLSKEKPNIVTTMMKSGSLAKSDVLAAKSGRSLSTIMESPANARRDGGGAEQEQDTR